MTAQKWHLVLCAAVSLVLVLVGNVTAQIRMRPRNATARTLHKRRVFTRARAPATTGYGVDESMLLESYVHDDQKETALLVLSWQRSGSGSFIELLMKNHYGMDHELLNP